jgi:hypothetical protein
MPDRPTEEQVRGLLAEYSPPSPPKCRKCGEQTNQSHITGESVYFDCPACRAVCYFQNTIDPEIVALCEDWLGLREAARVVRDNVATEPQPFPARVALRKLLKAIGEEPHAQP